MLFKLINNIEDILSSLLIAIMSIFAFLNVISRHFISMPMNFAEELNVYLFVWLAFLGSARAVYTNTHLSVNLIYNLFSNRFRKYIYLCTQFVAIMFFASLAYCGYVEILDEIALNALTETLTVPVWLFTSSISFGSVLVIFRIVQRTYLDIKHATY